MPFENRIPHPLTPHGVRTYAPVIAGVYGISNSREWVFIGAADNIQRALLDRLSANDTAERNGPPPGFVFETCMGETRTARVASLKREYAPAGNAATRSRSQSALQRRRDVA